MARLELIPTDEEREIRAAVRGICGSFPDDYARTKHAAGEASNMAKYAAAEAAIECVDRAIQTHGGNGFALEYGLSDMWWAVRLTRTAPVSREMILNYVAEHSLGLPKSY